MAIFKSTGGGLFHRTFYTFIKYCRIYMSVNNSSEKKYTPDEKDKKVSTKCQNERSDKPQLVIGVRTVEYIKK